MRRLEGRTGDLAWDTAGALGDPGLILIHSLGADSRMWADQTPILRQRRRLIWFDLPGHGSSSAAEGEYSIESLARDATDVAKAAGVETFDVCGISLGGVVALWMAANQGDQVETLIACNTGAKIGTEEAWSQRIDTVLAGGMVALRESVVPRFITSDLERRRPQAHRLVYEMFDGVDPIGYAGCCASLRDADLRGSLGDIGVPTLLIGGTDDIATPPDVMRGLEESIPGSKLTLIEGAAHLSNIDQPERFNDAIAAVIR